ncbi:hypothetical protein BDN71DRAFT_1391830, partial [Pleurotus eryngii]
TDIAIDLDIPLHVVQRTLKTWKDTGDVVVARAWNGCLPVIRGDSLDVCTIHHLLPPYSLVLWQFLLALVEQDPDIYLDEIQWQLVDHQGIQVSLPTIDRTLHRLGITNKKLSRAVQEHSDEARWQFTLTIEGEPPERLVCADEAAVNILTSYRENGWSFHGLRAHKQT